MKNAANYSSTTEEPSRSPASKPPTIYRLGYFSIPLLCAMAVQAGVWCLRRFTTEDSDQYSLPTNLLELFTSLIVVFCVFQVANLCLLGTSRWRNVLNGATLALCLGPTVIHVAIGHPLDFYFVGDNFVEIFYPQSIVMIVTSVTWDVWVIFLECLIILGVLGFTTRMFSYWPQPAFRRRSLLGYAAILVFFTFGPLYPKSDLTFLVRTASDYTFGRHSYPGIQSSVSYPYVKRASPLSTNNDVPRPHIFLIVMESFNANFVEQTTESGEEYTPVFNAKLEQGMYVERFYGNSIQTTRAHLPIFCSIPPSIWGKVSTDYADIRLQSIVHLLKNNGYRPLYFQSQESLEFDNTANFMRHLGFDEVFGMDEKFVSPDESKFVWGWGLQDDKTFQKVFSYLDDIQINGEQQGSSQPVFVTIFTTSHHVPFNAMPNEQKHLFPAPMTREHQFANSIHLADRFLKEFFQQLEQRPEFKESLVIITGDHSFPAGEHGNYFNENQFYEENFRIPLLVLWPNVIQPQRVDTVHSQLDIAPTLFDLLELNEDHHFIGHSILKDRSEPMAIPLIQPYDGTYLCSLSYPYKYVQRIRVPGEYLFDLAADPEETVNIVEDAQYAPIIARLRKEIVRLHFNQQLIERDRIWPE